jgi:putative oxidoreductase
MSIRQLRRRFVDAQVSLVLLRVIVGFGFIAHGYAKLERGPEHFADVLAAIGVPAPGFTAWLTTLVELVGGAALVVGAFVVPVCCVLAIVMLTAMFAVHLPYGFSSVKLVEITPVGARFGPVGYEINLLYVAALVVFATVGASPLSLDRWRSSRRSV